MAFLDNSGDIILDAVLTDTGRYRLAKGDGSFRIAKFALGDDEIDYSLYDKTQASAYVDLDILNTPVLEAFTDNAIALKSKLLSIPRNDLLFLPVIKIFEISDSQKTDIGVFCVCADEDTQKAFSDAKNPTGLFAAVESGDFKTVVRVHQGLDTTNISFARNIDSDLKETQYIVELDSRLGMIKTPEATSTEVNPSFIDDDRIASYYLSLTNNSAFVNDIVETTEGGSSIRGPRGTQIQFKLQAAMDLQYSSFLFQQLGTSANLTINTVTKEFYYIDTNVRVTGATTGYRLDIPVRFIKLK
jgi:hypothetical protein